MNPEFPVSHISPEEFERKIVASWIFLTTDKTKAQLIELLNRGKTLPFVIDISFSILISDEPHSRLNKMPEEQVLIAGDILSDRRVHIGINDLAVIGMFQKGRLEEYRKIIEAKTKAFFESNET